MPNFFTDNIDLKFHFNRFDLREILEIQEDNYEQKKKFDYAPENYEDAMINLETRRWLQPSISGPDRPSSGVWSSSSMSRW